MTESNLIKLHNWCFALILLLPFGIAVIASAFGFKNAVCVDIAGFVLILWFLAAALFTYSGICLKRLCD